METKIVKMTASEAGFPLDLEVSSRSFAQSMRVLRQNWRQGTVACKGRADVAFSNKKPWKQKGTGRARAGSARSPVWRKGGVIFGPQARVRMLSMPVAMNRKVLGSIVSSFLKHEKVLVAQAQFAERPRTKDAVSLLRAAGLEQSKVLLFAMPTDASLLLSFSNIPTVKIVSYDAPNAYDLSDADCWLVMEGDVQSFKEMVKRWI